MGKYNTHELTEFGKIVELGEKQEGTGREGRHWARQDFVLEITIGFNAVKTLKVRALTDGVAVLALCKAGDYVAVTYTVSSRKSDKGYWFTDVTAKDIDRVADEGFERPAPAEAPAPAPTYQAPTSGDICGDDDDNDELPF